MLSCSRKKGIKECCRLQASFEGINKNWQRAAGVLAVCRRRIGRDRDCVCRRGALAEIGYFLLALLTSRGAHERHYEFIGSREPNELPSPGIYRRQKSLILDVLFFPWHFHDRLPIFPAPLLFSPPPPHVSI